jgi:hypothetical protein
VEFTDPLGRQHSGRPGDYLVQSAEGLLRVAPREIFEDVYVPMDDEPTAQLASGPDIPISATKSLTL